MRRDLEIISEIISSGARVLDLGCGNGELLLYLKNKKSIYGLGVEIDAEEVRECLSKGLNVIQYDINRGLNFIGDDAFDYVVLSKTIQQLKSPGKLLEEVLRISRNAIISFPNFGNIKVRTYLLFRGQMPVTSELPYSWFDTPNIHLFTLKDFVNLCRIKGVKIEKIIPITKFGCKSMIINLLPNLLAEEVIVVVRK
ncbi:MAG: methionine biosynthesis protein MetW [Brevinematales bacterium]|nr:methionine biosynthesis protein MetW [Brevinematales bacterium]